MRHLAPLLASLFLLGASASSVQPQPSPGGAIAPVFSSFTILDVVLEAPLADLFSRGRKDEDYVVPGTLKVTDPAGGRTTTIENVQVGTRGHTSLRESECAFPKLKIAFGPAARVEGSPFGSMEAVKIGTHCGDQPDGPGGKYGRWPNEKAAHREAFVYRLLEVMHVPTLKARPARITYLDSRSAGDGAQPVVRSAMLLEDDEEALKRYGAHAQLPPKRFGSAPSVFAMPDIARLTFAQAMIGNFDWCLRMSPRDTYRCNDTTPLWNVLGLVRSGGLAVPVIQDFDLAGMVTTRHIWFASVFNRAYAKTEQEVEVLAQLQRTRSVFPRDLLDATRSEMAARKAPAYEALAQSPIDDEGRGVVKAYLDAFFAAIETDESFYRPVIVARALVHLDAASARPACSEEAPAGTPVSAPLETAGDKSRVILLDALWHWAEKCEAVRLNPVWIPTAVINTNYPP
jgi:hypothetical protein